MCTVKPLNSGHIGGKAFVRCREVVPILEVGWPATPLNPEVVINSEGCGLRAAESAISSRH